jgi:N-glycosidase YbiA
MYPSSDKHLNYETDDAVYWFTTAYVPLDNWSAHAVKIWGKKFPTVEHAYHYRKYDDTAPAVAKEMLGAPSPWAAMQIDRKNADKRRKDWDDVKVGIMTEIVRAKAAQNEDVRASLLQTGTKRIVENSPRDTFWGCGEDGTGQNQMGKILMLVRNEFASSLK